METIKLPLGILRDYAKYTARSLPLFRNDIRILRGLFLGTKKLSPVCRYSSL